MATRRLLEAFEFRSPVYAFAVVEAREVDAAGNDTGSMIRLYDSPSGGSQLPNPFTLDRYGRVQQDVYFEQRHRLVGTAKAIPGGFASGVFETFPTPDQSGADATTPFLESSDVGVKGDGTTDDTQAINQAAVLWSAKGGATFWLTAAPGKSILLAGSVLVPSGISLIFGSPVSYGTFGGIRCAGARSVALAANLLVDVGSLPTSTVAVDTTGLGGGALSGYFSVGDYVDLAGQKDSGGWPIASDEDLRVNTVNDGTSQLTFNRQITTAYPRINAGSDYTAATGLPDLTEVRKLVRAVATADVVAGSKSGSFGLGLGGLARGDYATIEDDKTCADAVAGSTTALIHRELLRIEDISGATVTFDREVRHTFEAAYHARLTRIEPAIDAHVSGAAVSFAAPAATFPVHSFEHYCAVGCSIEDCRIENLDLYGSRGTGYRGTLSYRSGYRRTLIRDPKFTAAGEGYGAANFYCTEFFNEDHEAVSCRHTLLYLGDSGSRFARVKGRNSLFGHVDFHGCEERGTSGRGLDTEGGTCMVSFGHNASWSGTFDCVIDGAVSRDTTGSHVEAVAPASRCGVRNLDFSGGTNLLHVNDCPCPTSAGDALQALDIFAERGTVRGVTADWVVSEDGAFFRAGRTTSVGRTRLDDILFQGCTSKLFRLYNSVAPIITGCQSYNPVLDGIDTYSLRASACSGIIFTHNDLISQADGFALTNCPSSLFANNTYLNWSGGSEYNNGGGNTGVHAQGNIALGFSKTNAFPT